MEFVTITILMIVVILQIIILARQNNNGNMVRELIAQNTRPQQSERDRFRDRKDQNFKQHRRSQQDFRSKPPHSHSAAPSGSVDNVEKSLRDINLKLKNAERDQEAARRKIHENTGREQPSRREHGDSNRDRGGRDHRRDRHNNRNSNWKNRQFGDRPVAGENLAPGSPETESPSPNPPVIVDDQRTTPQSASLPEITPTDFDTENTQHGRKFMVKRRILKDESSPGQIGPQADLSSGETGLSQSETNVEKHEQTPNSSDQSSDTEIHFGRR